MRVLDAKTNIVGTVAIALLSSVATVLLTHWFAGARDVSMASAPAVVSQPTAQPSVAPDILACGDAVYSPVQRRCVDQATFDAEMKRLFAALGLDAGIYASDAAPNAGSE